MIVAWTMVGVLLAATAGILIYRWGVSDGVALCKRANRAALTGARRERREHGMTPEQMTRQWQEIANFMRYDGSEMPRIDGGDKE